MARKPSPKVRRAVYVLNAVAAPFVTYAYARGWIGDLEVALVTAELAAAFALAGVNTRP